MSLSKWFHSFFHDKKIPEDIVSQKAEARRAVEEAILALEKLERQEMEAKTVANSLRDRRELNHFGSLLVYAMSRKTPRQT